VWRRVASSRAASSRAARCHSCGCSLSRAPSRRCARLLVLRVAEEQLHDTPNTRMTAARPSNYSLRHHWDHNGHTSAFCGSWKLEFWYIRFIYLHMMHTYNNDSRSSRRLSLCVMCVADEQLHNEHWTRMSGFWPSIISLRHHLDHNRQASALCGTWKLEFGYIRLHI
jgi:hypothetical protein